LLCPDGTHISSAFPAESWLISAMIAAFVEDEGMATWP